MPSRKTRYMKLDTDEENVGEDEEDEAPPARVQLHTSQYVKANRWNHIENLDEFFDRVYYYQQNKGLLAIALSDVFELAQFAFIVLFSTFVLTCLRFDRLFRGFKSENGTADRDVILSDLFEVSRLRNINALLVFIVLLAGIFWCHRFGRAIWRFFKFWEIQSFFKEVLDITPAELRNYGWRDVLQRMKDAQKEFKMNIQKHELTELDVYHRMLRFKNYMVAMVNKDVLPTKLPIPLYEEIVFFTNGLKYNYELLLFWGPGAPFKNSFYLREEFKSAAKKNELIRQLKFRIGVLALLNLLFCPFILLYQILYSFFSYAELLKRQPGMFGRRRWSLYGRVFLRHFNELDHELMMRLNRVYEHSVKYMDLFVSPVGTIIARNVAFLAGSMLGVLLVMTVIQEDLLTAQHVLTIITALGITVTICRIWIPDEHQELCPRQLMGEILQGIHYMPDEWKQRPHTLQVSRSLSQVFQLTVAYLIEELMSPLVTPFVLYFSLRRKAPQIIDFLRNFTIEVSGVGDVCSFAEMDVRKHGHPDWQQAPQVTIVSRNEQAELGKTELSLLEFTRKNPCWEPSDEATMYISQLKESMEEMRQSQLMDSQQQVSSLTSSSFYQPPSQSLVPSVTVNGQEATATGSSSSSIPARTDTSMIRSTGSLSNSLWASTTSSISPLAAHQVHDRQRQQQHIHPLPHSQPSSGAPITLTVYDTYSDSSMTSSETQLDTNTSTAVGERLNLTQPLLTSLDNQ